jgi:hypothetical protein
MSSCGLCSTPGGILSRGDVLLLVNWDILLGFLVSLNPNLAFGSPLAPLARRDVVGVRAAVENV